MKCHIKYAIDFLAGKALFVRVDLIRKPELVAAYSSHIV